jgi:hypothetical protein
MQISYDHYHDDPDNIINNHNHNHYNIVMINVPFCSVNQTIRLMPFYIAVSVSFYSTDKIPYDHYHDDPDNIINNHFNIQI